MNKEFLQGFSDGSTLDLAESDRQWAGWSYQLSDSELEKMESYGYDEGKKQGVLFRAEFIR